MTEKPRLAQLGILHKYDYHTYMERTTRVAVLPRAAAAAIERALRIAPVVVLLGARQTGKTTLVRSLWFSGYVQTYLERDLQALRAVENLADFRRVMRAACLRIGTLLNQTELGRDVGISQPQVHRFMNLMEASYQAVRLPAYSVNRTRRLIKAPKFYWSDTALALHLAGESEPRGAHLENLVLTDLLAWRDGQRQRPDILYWRTAAGQEVDFVVETPKRLLPIEVKTAARVTPADAKGLETFLDDSVDIPKAGNQKRVPLDGDDLGVVDQAVHEAAGAPQCFHHALGCRVCCTFLYNYVY